MCKSETGTSGVKETKQVVAVENGTRFEYFDKLKRYESRSRLLSPTAANYRPFARVARSKTNTRCFKRLKGTRNKRIEIDASGTETEYFRNPWRVVVTRNNSNETRRRGARENIVNGGTRERERERGRRGEVMEIEIKRGIWRSEITRHP